MSARRGLPQQLKPRHDKHYVEALTEPSPETVGIMIATSKVKPNSDQPRSVIGDLSGLKASIKEKGILEPLVVKEREDHYIIISGERRYRAAVELNLKEIPCIVRESDKQDTLEVALIENLQRKDLTAFEEADALNSLSKDHKLSHEDIGRKIGKSRTAVTETSESYAIITALQPNQCSCK